MLMFGRRQRSTSGPGAPHYPHDAISGLAVAVRIHRMIPVTSTQRFRTPLPDVFPLIDCIQETRRMNFIHYQGDIVH